MFKRSLLFILAGISLSSLLNAQCGTDEMMKIVRLRDAALDQRLNEMNSKAAAYSLQPSGRAAIYTIPVVFHIIHTGGEENISREQVLDQIRILNADYQKKNWNIGKVRSQFTSRIADCQIQFKLATIDPNGNCTDGINRVYSPLGVNVDQSTEEIKDLISWNTARYLNVWVVTSITSQSGSGTTLGYAYFPTMTPASKNGVVVRHDRIGSIGTALNTADSGRTCTHEVGHWLGLYHTFENGCSSPGDYCDDTPPVNGTFTNASCPANGNSCTNDSPDLPDMWEDYMDYSSGTCMGMFSNNQKTRMHSALTQYRATLISSSNLIATGVNAGTGAPLANFTSNQRTVCAGTPVQFWDISCKAAVTGRSWTFTGASTPSSTAANPVVTWQTAGTYKVSLFVQNGSGSNTKTVDNYITVISPSNSVFPNIEETFENGDPTGRGFRSRSPRPWAWIDSVGYTGTHCFRAPVKATDTPGTVYTFVTPYVDLTKLSSSIPKLTFYLGYAQRNTSTIETLRISVSTDCGNSFTQFYERSGTVLQYNGGTATPNFVPKISSHWKRLGPTNLSAYTTSSAAIFKFDVVSGGGNPVYIDNINISEWFAGTRNFQTGSADLKVYPNPVQGESRIQFSLSSNCMGQAALYDLSGKKVMDIYSGPMMKGQNSLILRDPGVLKSAIYLLKITTPEGEMAKAVTFAP